MCYNIWPSVNFILKSWRGMIVRWLIFISECFLMQYMPHVLHTGKHLFDRFAVIFSVVIVWIYAHLLTVGGAYNNAAPKTQVSCRTDRAGLIDGAPWWVGVASFKKLLFCSFCLWHLSVWLELQNRKPWYLFLDDCSVYSRSWKSLL